MNSLWHDIKYAIRQLLKSPVFTVCVVLVLALGIATNTAFFSALDGIFFRSLPFEDSNRIMTIWSKSSDPSLSHFPYVNTSVLDYEDWVEQNTSFTELAATLHEAFNLTNRDEPLALMGYAATSNLFDVFGTSPVLGRHFTPEEEQANAKVVVLTHSLWKQAFGGSEDVVGQQVTLNNHVYTVIGVASPFLEYRQDFKIQCFVPLNKAEINNRMARCLWVLGRLKPGVTQEQAATEMKMIAARLEAKHPETNTNWSTLIIPFHELFFGKTQNSLLILFSAAVLLLLIACANVANLLLSRAGTRCQEMAVRAALGSGCLRLFRLMLIESLLLSMTAGMIGFISAVGGMDLLQNFITGLSQTGAISGVIRITMNPWILVFAIALSVFTTLCFGLVPAWQTSQVNPIAALQSRGRSNSPGRKQRRLSNCLVSAEIAVAFVLLIGASLLFRSMNQLHQTSPGFNPVNLTTVQLTLPNNSEYEQNYQRVTFCNAVLDNIKNIPGVQSVASTNIHPMSNGNISNYFRIVNHDSQIHVDAPAAEQRTVSIDYFSTIGLPLVEGRLFRETDDGSAGVVIIDQELARRYFPDKSPIGQTIEWDRPDNEFCEIVGVVGNHQSTPSIDEQTCPHIYEPIGQACMNTVTFIARTNTDPLMLSESLRRAVWAVNPNQPINKIQSMQGIVRDSMSMRRISSLMFCFFAGSAVVITLIGIYGVISSSVSQRRYEIGLRMTLGANRRNIINSIMKKGLVLTGLGVIVGLGSSLLLCRFLNKLLYNVSPVDIASYILVVVVISVASLLACYIPARRAAKIDPMEALRYE